MESTESVEVRARVNGYLQSIHFKDGQMVKKGDLLFVRKAKRRRVSSQFTKPSAAGGNDELERDHAIHSTWP